jgi:LysR family transcriptional regulator for metE and metH
MIENSHLRILQALNQHGTLTKAANALCLSQSALSHQIRYLEKKLNITLWEKEGRLLRLTKAGELLLQVAQQVLPVLQQAEETLKAYSEGRQGVLRIGVECYPCSKWLNSVVGNFLQQLPDIEIDIVNKFQFSGLEGLLNHHIDVLVTPDLERNEKIHYEPIAEYDLVLLVSSEHRLSDSTIIQAEEFSQETLLSFPIPIERMDIMTQFLIPEGVRPDNIKEIESINLMIQLVSLGRGVCVLPEWLATHYCKKPKSNTKLKPIRLGKRGIRKKLYLAMHHNDQNIPYIKTFINTGKDVAKHLF